MPQGRNLNKKLIFCRISVLDSSLEKSIKNTQIQG